MRDSNSISNAGYAGHMAKANQIANRHLAEVDIIIVMLDARAPMSSLRPFLGKRLLEQYKSKVFLLLNKQDLADPEVTEKWIRYFENDGYRAIGVNARDKKSAAGAVDFILNSRQKEGRRASYFPRAMMIGVPNIGKSSFINSVAGETKTHVGNKAGITRGKQWVVTDSLELLDMPGILQSNKLEENELVKLACLSSINDENTDSLENAYYLYRIIGPEKIGLYYETELDEDMDFETAMNEIALKRKMIMRGGVGDIERASLALINDFRTLRFGRISLEVPDEQ